MRLILGLLVVALTLAGCTGASSSSGGGGKAVAPSVQHSASPTAEALPGSTGSAGAAAAGTGSASSRSAAARDVAQNLPPLGPQVIKTAQVALRVPHGQIERVIIQATHVAGNQRGYVLSTNVARVSGYAELVMRVPAARFENALAALASLQGVTVTAQTVTGQEVGQQFVDLNARARNLEAQEVVLRRLMGQATTVSDTISVENQLFQVQGQLDQIQGRLRYLADQTALSTITVEMREHVAAPPPPPGKPSTIGGAFRRGWQAAQDVVAGVIVAVGFALPIALLVLLILVLVLRLRPLAARLASRSSQHPAAD